MKWSSSPRWVSNSHNPTGQHGGLCLATAPHQPGFPFPAASHSLSAPFCLSNPPPTLRRPPVAISKKLMRLCWHYSSPPTLCVFVSSGHIHSNNVNCPFYLKRKKQNEKLLWILKSGRLVFHPIKSFPVQGAVLHL